MFIEPRHSSRRTRPGQSARQRPTASTVVCLLWLIAISHGGNGCSSIYHQTRDQLPPEPLAELNLRVAEAREAETRVEQAGAQLRKQLCQPHPDTFTAADFDRLETATFELERRVLAACQAAARSGGSACFDTEIARLRRRTSVWQGYVEIHRAADPATRLRQLDSLLRDPSQPPPIP
ncbi:MAG: hypothetical protein KJ072_03815 [Verrucomicrobia bacterium]|nr:hypothetical protein [Verrucomicrobiota bacterium]